MSNINRFLNQFRNEFSRPCNFEVIIDNPPVKIMTPDELRFRCDVAELPSRTFALTQQKIYGPISYHPVQSAYDKITLSFICSEEMREKEFFDAWLTFISPNKNDVGVGFGGINLGFNVKGVLFDFEYYDRFVTTVRIVQKSLHNTDTYTVTLHEAYPISVNSMPLSWDSLDAVHKVTVSFAFRYFTEKNTYSRVETGIASPPYVENKFATGTASPPYLENRPVAGNASPPYTFK